MSLAAGSHTVALQWKAESTHGSVPWYVLNGIGGFFQASLSGLCVTTWATVGRVALCGRRGFIGAQSNRCLGSIWTVDATNLHTTFDSETRSSFTGIDGPLVVDWARLSTNLTLLCRQCW